MDDGLLNAQRRFGAGHFLSGALGRLEDELTTPAYAVPACSSLEDEAHYARLGRTRQLQHLGKDVLQVLGVVCGPAQEQPVDSPP